MELRPLTKRERDAVGRHAVQHGKILALRRPISDSEGRISSPLVRVDTIGRLERSGTITPQMADAAARFHTLFQRAGLDGLRAADPSRPFIEGGLHPGDRGLSGHDGARRRVAAAVAALGGHGSILGSAVWHVAGLEWSVRRWSQTAQRREEVALGVLIAALAALALHFAGERR
jgi:hypothetical protein